MNQSPNLNRSWEESQQIIKDLENQITQLKQEAQACRCHIIDPSKMRILLWINRHKDGKPDTCVLKIAEQRLLGLPRSDRRGETYWRFDEIIEVKKEETPQVAFKCSDCQKETLVINADNPAEEIRQREALRKELAQVKEIQESQKENSKTEPKISEQANSPKTPRQILKEQISQAVQENEQAELKPKAQTKENHEMNSDTSNQANNPN